MQNVDIGRAILKAKIKDLIKDGGGHAMAGGFSVDCSKFNELKEFFIQELSNDVENYLNNKERDADLVLECKSLSINLANEIEKLGPFGAGNHKPKIILKNVVMLAIQIMIVLVLRKITFHLFMLVMDLKMLIIMTRLFITLVN